jgi:hypothetical protein
MDGLRGRAGVGALVVAVAAFGPGCGASALGGNNGPAPPETCGMVTPCGGELVGTWKLLGGCSEPLFWLNCPPDVRTVVVGVSYSGTLTFNADMTYATADFAQTGAQSYTFPSSCLGGYSCASSNNYCSGGSTCTCSQSGTAATFIVGSGTYTVNGDNLTFSQPNTSTIAGITYCVQGGLLHLETYQTLPLSDGGSTSVVTTDVVAQIQ